MATKPAAKTSRPIRTDLLAKDAMNANNWNQQLKTKGRTVMAMRAYWE